MAVPESKPPDPPTSLQLSRYHAMARAILTLALLLFGIWILRGLLVPLIWATILAFASWPLYQRLVGALSDLGWDELVPPIAFTLLVGLIFLVPLALVALEFARDAPNVAHWVRSIEQKGLGAPDWIGRIPLAGSYIFDWWNTNLSDPRAATELLGRLNRNVLVYWVSSLGTQVLYRLTDLLFTLLTLFFLYRQGATLARQLRSFANMALGESADRLIEQMLLAVRGAVNGLVLVGFGEGFVLGIFYAIFGVPHPVILGALTGIVAAIPFGVFVMFALAATILLVQSSPAAACFSWSSVSQS
jgi:predicted PurR-regulated permease PerM